MDRYRYRNRYRYKYRCVCICVYVHLHLHVHACMYLCLYVCMHACMHACVHACIYNTGNPQFKGIELSWICSPKLRRRGVTAMGGFKRQTWDSTNTLSMLKQYINVSSALIHHTIP